MKMSGCDHRISAISLAALDRTGVNMRTASRMLAWLLLLGVLFDGQKCLVLDMSGISPCQLSENLISQIMNNFDAHDPVTGETVHQLLKGPAAVLYLSHYQSRSLPPASQDALLHLYGDNPEYDTTFFSPVAVIRNDRFALALVGGAAPGDDSATHCVARRRGYTGNLFEIYAAQTHRLFENYAPETHDRVLAHALQNDWLRAESMTLLDEYLRIPGTDLTLKSMLDEYGCWSPGVLVLFAWWSPNFGRILSEYLAPPVPSPTQGLDARMRLDYLAMACGIMENGRRGACLAYLQPHEASFPEPYSLQMVLDRSEYLWATPAEGLWMDLNKRATTGEHVSEEWAYLIQWLLHQWSPSRRVSDMELVSVSHNLLSCHDLRGKIPPFLLKSLASHLRTFREYGESATEMVRLPQLPPESPQSLAASLACYRRQAPMHWIGRSLLEFELRYLAPLAGYYSDWTQLRTIQQQTDFVQAALRSHLANPTVATYGQTAALIGALILTWQRVILFGVSFDTGLSELPLRGESWGEFSRSLSRLLGGGRERDSLASYTLSMVGRYWINTFLTAEQFLSLISQTPS